MPRFQLSIIYALIWTLLSCQKESEAYFSEPGLSELPNIIFILADDLGYGDLGCYGHPYAKTPNLDRLAQSGIRLHRFYASAVTCSPSRAAFLTGVHPAKLPKYPAYNGLEGQIALTEILNAVGYRTAHFGKWHIGLDESPGTYGIETINTAPQRKEGKGDNPNITDQLPDFPGGRDQLIFEEARKYIRKRDERPFFMNIWGNITHAPVNPKSELLGESFANLRIQGDEFGHWFAEDKITLLEEKGFNPNDGLRKYLLDVYALDYQVGELIKALQQTGKLDNTIIVFSSDQGPERIISTEKNQRVNEFKSRKMGFAGGLRGSKHTQYEGGTRVPFIVSWPGKIPAGAIDSTSVASALDFLPTICALLQIDLHHFNLHGTNVSSVLRGEPAERDAPLFWKRFHDSKISILDGAYKLHQINNNEYTLYHLENDPFEQHDISQDNPEITKRMKEIAEQWRSEGVVENKKRKQ